MKTFGTTIIIMSTILIVGFITLSFLVQEEIKYTKDLIRDADITQAALSKTNNNNQAKSTTTPVPQPVTSSIPSTSTISTTDTKKQPETQSSPTSIIPSESVGGSSNGTYDD